jgi:hypothetical protein
MKNKTLALILAVSGILLGAAVYRTIAEKAQENQVNDPFVQGPQSSPEYDESDEDDFFGGNE